MKSTIEPPKTWLDIGQFAVHNENSLVLLVCQEAEDGLFGGVVVFPMGEYQIGDFSPEWENKNFHRWHGSITLED